MTMMTAEAATAMQQPGIPLDYELPDDADFGNDVGGSTPEAETALPPVTQKAQPEPEPEVEAQESENYDNRIPRHRFNYAQQKRREAEERAKQLEAELEQLKAAKAQSDQPQEPSKEQYIMALDTRIGQLDKEIEAARLDNDAEKAAQLRAEQRRYERALVKLENEPPKQPDPQEYTKQTFEELRVVETINSLERAYPILNQDHPQFNAEISDEVMDTFDAFVAKGMNRDIALSRAAAYVLAAHGINGQGGPARKTNMPKNVRAAGAQPPTLETTGFDGDKGGVSRKLDITNMKQEDFEKLSGKDLDELLGNFDV